MNNSTFLSDYLKSNSIKKFEFNQGFISAEESSNLNAPKFISEKYSPKNADNRYAIKSAISRKWSIKFK